MGFLDRFRKPTKKEITWDRMQKIRERGKEGELYSERDNYPLIVDAPEIKFCWPYQP